MEFFVATLAITVWLLLWGRWIPRPGRVRLDGFLVNAAMLITGNGPINELKTPAGRLFAAADALFGEALYVIVVAVLLTPIVHRMLHSFHLDIPEQKNH